MENLEAKKEEIINAIKSPAKKSNFVKVEPTLSPPKEIPTDVPVVEPPKKKSAAPRKRPPIKKAAPNEDIKVFLAGVSQIAVAATKEPIWMLHESELDLIANPAARILEKNELSEETRKYGDYVMLAIGLAIVTIPRITYMREKNAMKKLPKKEVVRSGDQREQGAPTTGQDTGTSPPPVSDDYKSVFDQLGFN